MHAFRSQDFHDSLCQKMWTLVQTALSYRENLGDVYLRYLIELHVTN